MLNFKKEQFIERHLENDSQIIKEMLSAVGASSLEELIEQTIPEDIRLKQDLNLPAPLTEIEFTSQFKKLARKTLLSLLPAGREAKSIVIASAAAVASSSREALAISIPVRSVIMVW